jgi:hypothetical protein
MLAKLHSVGVHRLPAEGWPLIAEVEEDVGFQSLLSADPRSSTKRRPVNRISKGQELLEEDARKPVAERETQRIAEYDAYFLASMRIKYTSQASTRESLRSFPGDSFRDCRADNERRT